MNWQLIMASGLAVQVLMCLYGAWRVHRTVSGITHMLTPRLRLLAALTPLTMLMPLSEAAVLWMAGFWTMGGC